MRGSPHILRMLETYQRIDQYACPRLERESLCQTNMRTVSHGVSTQNGTRQCRDSMNNIWRSEAEAKPSDVRSECALMSKKYIGNCRCQTCSNPESSRKAHIARSLHVWKECLRYLFYRGTVCRGDWAWLLINVTVTHSVFHWA